MGYIHVNISLYHSVITINTCSYVRRYDIKNDLSVLIIIYVLMCNDDNPRDNSKKHFEGIERNHIFISHNRRVIAIT